MNDDILILCPEVAQQRRLQRLAFDLGASTALALDGDDALQRLRATGAPLALVVDPGPRPEEALQLLQALRAQAPPQRSALLVLAANADVEAAVRAQAGALGLAGLMPNKATALAMHGQWSAMIADQRAQRAQQLRTALRPPMLPKPAAHPARAGHATATLSAPAAGPKAARPAAAPAPRGPLASVPEPTPTKAPVPPTPEPLAAAPTPASPPAEPPMRDPLAQARIAGLSLARGLDLDAALQRLAQDAAHAFGAHGAVLALELEDGAHFAAWQGPLPGVRPPTPAEWGECLAALNGDLPAALRVPDAASHPALRGLVMVARGALGACLTAPLMTADGAALGTACLVEPQRKDWEAGDLEQWSALARRWAEEVGLAQQVGRLHRDLDAQWDEAAASGERVDALRAVLENLETGVLLHDSNGRILIANRRLADHCGLLALQIEGAALKDFAAELAGLFDDPEDLPPGLRSLPEGPYSLREVLATQRPRRQVLRWHARPIPWGPAWYELITVEDVSAEVELESHRLDPAFIDAVTGLPDAHAAKALGERAAEQARHRGRPLSLLLLELDGQQGRGGERLLMDLGVLLRTVPRPTDRATLWGRACYLLLFPETDEAPARRVAEQLRQAVAALPGKPTLSGGLAWGPGGTPFATLLESADRRLALAASSGGNAIL